MDIYHYNPTNGELTGHSTARKDPIDDLPMVPAHATAIVPPSSGVNRIAVFNGSQWVTKLDYRHTTYWLPDGSRGEINDIGIEPPLNALPVPPEKTRTNAEFTIAGEQSIDAICERIYTKYASRATRYSQKYSEALRYKAAGYPHPAAEADYPYIVAESTHRPQTKHQLADLIIAKADAFNQFGAQAEAARAELPVATAAASSQTDKQTTTDAIVDRINTLAQPLEA